MPIVKENICQYRANHLVYLEFDLVPAREVYWLDLVISILPSWFCAL